MIDLEDIVRVTEMYPLETAGLYKEVNNKPLFSNPQDRVMAYKKLFLQTEFGKAVLQDLLNFCGAFTIPVNTSSEMQTHVNLGKQIVSTHLLTLLHTDLELIKEKDDG